MTTPSDPFGPPPDDRREKPGDQPGGSAPWGTPPGQPPPAQGQQWGAPGGQQWGAPGQQQPYGSAPWGGTGAAGPKRNGLGVAALVLGILAVLTSFTVLGGVLLGLAAIVLGALGRGRVKRGEADNGGSAVAGIVLGVIGLLIAGAVVAAGVAFFESDTGRSLVDCLEQAGDDVAAQQACQQEVLEQVEQ